MTKCFDHQILVCGCGISGGWSYLVSAFGRITGTVLAQSDEQCFDVS